MTEDEAKTKWCPMVRFVIGPQSPTWQEAAFDNRSTLNGTAFCLGSGCMAWREGQTSWRHWPAPRGWSVADEPPRPTDMPTGFWWDRDSRVWIESPEAHKARVSGYCGLAGAP